MRTIAWVAFFLAAGYLIGSREASAQQNDQQVHALQLIGDTADRICTTAKTSGGASSSTSKAQVDLALTGLSRALANLGISGSTEYATSNYDGPLEKDVLAASVESDSCKKHVFDALVTRLLPVATEKPTTSATPVTAKAAQNQTANWRTPKRSAVVISNEFLAKLDRDDWKGAYQTLSVETRAGADLQTYIALKQRGREKTGRTLSRELVGAMLSDKQPDPNEKTYVVAYESKVEHPFAHSAAPGDEVVVLDLAPSGTWTIVDYVCVICMAADLH